MARSKRNEEAFSGLIDRMDAPAPTMSASTMSASTAERASETAGKRSVRLPIDSTEKKTFRIRKDLLAGMKRACYEEDVTNSWVVNTAVEEWLSSRGYLS